MTKSSRLVVKPGRTIKNTSYTVNMATISPRADLSAKINSRTKNFPELTGTYGFWPSFDAFKDLWNAIWQISGGNMDVVASLQQTDKLGAIEKEVECAVNNPTIGYPYAVFYDSVNNNSVRFNLYENESQSFTDSTGTVYTITRQNDSDYKEFLLEVAN